VVTSNPSGQIGTSVASPVYPANAERPRIPGAMRAAGIIEIALGVVCALLALFWIVIGIMSAASPHDPNGFLDFDFTEFFFLVGAVCVIPAALGILLGIKTLRMRRWAVIGYLVVSLIVGLYMLLSQLLGGVFDAISVTVVVLAVVVLGVNALTLPNLKYTT
jgi:hypothetical protein